MILSKRTPEILASVLKKVNLQSLSSCLRFKIFPSFNPIFTSRVAALNENINYIHSMNGCQKQVRDLKLRESVNHKIRKRFPGQVNTHIKKTIPASHNNHRFFPPEIQRLDITKTVNPH